MKKRISLAISFCPNDTFSFESAICNLQENDSIVFDASYFDIQELNEKASEGIFDVIKISFAHYPSIAKDYLLLSSGAALGFNCGPLLIGKQSIEKKEALSEKKIAIPGKNTTAYLLLKHYLGNVPFIPVPTLFSDIEDSILEEKVDFGVIIHETRFTFFEKGLIEIADLGKHWETSFQLPIPLGAIAIHKRIPKKEAEKIKIAVQKSIKDAFLRKNYQSTFIKEKATELTPETIQKHINLYVNKESVELSKKGKEAVSTLFSLGETKVLNDRIYL